MFQLTPVVRNILIVNILVFLIPEIMNTSDLVVRIFGLHNVASPFFMAWQWVTYAFLHSGFNHILLNMLGLVFFGPMLESVWGAKKFLLFYLVCTLGAAALYNGISYYELQQQMQSAEKFYANPDPDGYLLFIKEYFPQYLNGASGFANQWENFPTSVEHIKAAKNDIDNLIILQRNVPMIGASGAIYGILAAFGLLFPKMELMLLFPPIPVKAWILISIYFVTSIYQVLNPVPGDNVAHVAHLGGMVIGGIFVYFWRTGSRYY